ncbi:MAG: HD domain-containing protein [Armatimonadetes bacterium]|nr:HD domain-containing protein [Armatimonadota bacterium]
MDPLDRIRTATQGSPYEGRLYLVGGVLRDRLLGRPRTPDIDIVVDGDAGEAAQFLHAAGLSEHAPVQYPRFGTARVQIGGVPIELASARAESYDGVTRKPTVRRGDLRDDVYRRDFTINTLIENLHTPGVLDITAQALPDLEAGIIRTPLDPEATFHDDPLRMLRAIRFAVTLDFTIEPTTWRGVCEQAHRIDLLGGASRVVSAERVRDEFVKIVTSPGPLLGLEQLRECGLLERFLPELCDTVGVTQNAWHAHDVWTHTVLALDGLPESAALEVRLGVLFHDIGKPATRTEDERGIHFYDHQHVGARLTHEALTRLRLPTDTVVDVTEIVRLHMRLGEVRPDWTPAAVRRLIRDVGGRLSYLEEVARADMAAMGGDAEPTDIGAVMERIERTNAEMNVCRIVSPLTGVDIMDALGVGEGRVVGQAKEFLVSEIIEGRLEPDDPAAAREALSRFTPDASAGLA